MIDPPQIVHSQAQQTAAIHFTIPRAQMPEVMGAAINELLAAIARARQRGSQVIVGVNQLLDQEPAAIPGLARAVSAWGLLCVGGRLGYASIAPLAVV